MPDRETESAIRSAVRSALTGGGPTCDKLHAAQVAAKVAMIHVEEERAITNRAIRFLYNHGQHHIDCNLSEWAMADAQYTEAPGCSCGLEEFVSLAERRGLV